MAQLRAWRGTAAASANLPQLQYKAELGTHLWVPPGGTADFGITVPVGRQLIFDFACFFEGEVCYRPKFDDSRMRLRGSDIPPFSGEDGYQGAIKLNVMVQRHGLCTLLSTSESVYRAVNLHYDMYLIAAEAQGGQLPVLRIEEARAFNTKYRPDPLFAPCYRLIGWVHRDADVFGPRLIPPPKPILVSAKAAPAIESDAVFSATTEVLPPEPVAAPKPKPARRAEKKPIEDDLDDELPF
jgi:hypothetical protein